MSDILHPDMIIIFPPKLDNLLDVQSLIAEIGWGNKRLKCQACEETNHKNKCKHSKDVENYKWSRQFNY